MKWFFHLVILMFASPAQAEIVYLFCTWNNSTSGFQANIHEDSKIVVHIYDTGALSSAKANFTEKDVSYTITNPISNYQFHYIISRIDLSLVMYTKSIDNTVIAYALGKCSLNQPDRKF